MTGQLQLNNIISKKEISEKIFLFLLHGNDKNITNSLKKTFFMKNSYKIAIIWYNYIR